MDFTHMNGPKSTLLTLKSLPLNQAEAINWTQVNSLDNAEEHLGTVKMSEYWVEANSVHVLSMLSSYNAGIQF